MPFGPFRRTAKREVIDRIHGDIVAAVRQPVLYREYGVEDTFEGRFEVLALMATLVIRRLSALDAPGPRIAQDVTDAVFAGIDGSMRELGVGDLAVPKRIKKFASAFLGRRQAYDDALRAGDFDQLAAALSRNLYGGRLSAGSPQVSRLARYALAVASALEGRSIRAIESDSVAIPPAGETEQEVK